MPKPEREANMATTESTPRKIAGVIGFFDDPTGLVAATAKVRDANYESFDVYTPYPVHGLDAAQGLKRSPLPYVTFVAGATGFILAMVLQYWTSAVDWPLNVGGKPFFSWPAFVPILFELTVLLGGLATVAGMFALNGLPNIFRKSFDPALTRDRFAIVVEAPAERDEEDKAPGTSSSFKAFSESEAADFLRKLGAKEVRTVYQEGWF